MPPTTILIVDDHDFYRETMIHFLESQPGYVVVGTAENGDEALEQAARLRPEIILIDLSMPVRSGMETIPLLRQLLPASRIVVLSIADETAYRKAAFAAGADAYVSKPEAADELLPALACLATAPGRTLLTS